MTFKSFVREETGWVATAVSTPLFVTSAALAAGWAESVWGLFTPTGLAFWGLGLLLSVVAVVDHQRRVMPFSINLLITLTGLAAAAAGVSIPLADSLLGLLVAFGGLWACAGLATRLAGRESVGGADIWLAGGLGTWGGLGALPMLMVCVSVLGLTVVVWRRFAGRTGAFAFGPILAFSGWVAALHGPLYWATLEQTVAWLAQG